MLLGSGPRVETLHVAGDEKTDQRNCRCDGFENEVVREEDRQGAGSRDCRQRYLGNLEGAQCTRAEITFLLVRLVRIDDAAEALANLAF